MKLKNLDQELEFIRSAEPKQLVAYVVNNRFSAQAEKQLIKRGITEASLFYIKAYGLKEPAQVEVFRANRPQLVDAVLESAADPCRTIALLLTHGEYNTVMKYLKRHDVPQYTERDIVWSGSEKAIISHINRHRISMFAKYDLIMRGNHNIIMLVIAKGRLNEREKLALLTRGTYEEVNFLIETQSNRKEAEKLRQMKMIRFNSRKKVEQFIARRRFVQEAEDFFFKHGAFSSTHLNFLSTALIFAAGSGVFFCAQPRSAGGVGSGKPRGVKGFGAGFPGLREAVESHVRTGRGCGKLCAGGQPGRLCGRAGASVRTGRGANRFSAWR